MFNKAAHLIKLLLVLLSFSTVLNVNGQQVVSVNDPATIYAEQLFEKTINGQSRLFNGREYEFYVGYQGTANFKTSDFFKEGIVTYYGFQYQHVPLIYDLFKDKLVTILPSGISKYSLVSEKIDSFQLHGHTFVYLDSAVIASNSRPGFFDQLYAGKSKILVKRSKIVQETIGTQALARFFIEKSAYFLVKDGTYYSFSSESKLLSLLVDKKKEIQRFIKDQNIKYKKDPELAMVKMITFYDSTKN